MNTTQKSRVPFNFLAAILFFAVISAFLLFGCNSLPAVSDPFATVTPTATITFTPTSTATSLPTAPPTRIPLPTPTVTPVPTWITEFAEPILTAIANNPPHFQDDFSRESDGWRYAKENGDRCWMEMKDGTLIMTVETGREVAICSHPGMRFNNFVLRVDVDLHKLASDTAAEIDWRGTGYSTGLVLYLWKDGRWVINFCGNSCSEAASGWQSINPTQKVTVTIISKVREYAIYMDEIPVSYINDSGRRPGIEIKLSLSADSISPKTIVAYDNLKIWNLDYIPNLP